MPRGLKRTSGLIGATDCRTHAIMHDLIEKFARLKEEYIKSCATSVIDWLP